MTEANDCRSADNVDLVKKPLSMVRISILFSVITLTWGSTWIVIHDQLDSVSPSWSVAYRFITGAIVMLGYAAISRVPLTMRAHGHMMAFIFGVAQFSLNFNFVYRAELYITSGLVAFASGLLLVSNAVLGWIFLGLSLTRRFIVGSVIALAGIALLFWHEVRMLSSNSVAGVWTGLGYALLAIMCASVANVMQASGRAKLTPLPATLFWGMLYGSIANIIWALVSVGPPMIDPSIGYLSGVVYLGAIASALIFPLYFSLVRDIGPAKAAYSGVSTPIVAMVLSSLFENYRWSGFAMGGAMLAIGGLLIALGERRPVPQPN